MADETTTPAPQAGRAGGNRDAGGFRIRLSDNEMRAARSIQEAFRLRSTVAVLGFSVRTLGQLLEEGQLEALVAQQQAAAGTRPERQDRSPRSERAGRDGGRGGRQERAPQVDPFARPSRPAAAAEPVPSPQPQAEPEPAEATQEAAESAADDHGEPSLEAEPSVKAEAGSATAASES
ncbi:hypothetical protein [Cyanobium sp. CH-040]|uniref:hypothetical protein n=1 Tax=Cyanobium sp. CH-040 TaxID=2823708 RepID=UPI0020CFD0FF|nr:hypothetical protein [Cyanobium sp. CH-040]